ncbi:hypothetical protein B0H34DRAFT_243418 [Crassisporium funariophilum]|nr:hypothetical protein B0H34DRAFT_243418 [Crassisporium funariophilum]
MKKTVSQWRCSECPKSFGRKGDLTRHKLLHDGIKPHVCDECEKAFSQYSGLKTHRNVHTKVKPFVCGFNACVASFGDPSSCARHRKETHRRVGAYRCPFPRCKSSIKRRSAFSAHLKKHNIDITKVDIDSLAPPLLPVPIPMPRRRSLRQIDIYNSLPLKMDYDNTHTNSLQRQFAAERMDTSERQYFTSDSSTIRPSAPITWPYGSTFDDMDPTEMLATLSAYSNPQSYYEDCVGSKLYVLDPPSYDCPDLTNSSSSSPKSSASPVEEAQDVKPNVLDTQEVYGSHPFFAVTKENPYLHYSDHQPFDIRDERTFNFSLYSNLSGPPYIQA